MVSDSRSLQKNLKDQCLAKLGFTSAIKKKKKISLLWIILCNQINYIY